MTILKKSLILIALPTLLVGCGQSAREFDCIGTKTNYHYINSNQNGAIASSASGFTFIIGKDRHIADAHTFNSMNNEGANLVSGISTYLSPSGTTTSNRTLTFDRRTGELKMSHTFAFMKQGDYYENRENFDGKCDPRQ